MFDSARAVACGVAAEPLRRLLHEVPPPLWGGGQGEGTQPSHHAHPAAEPFLLVFYEGDFEGVLSPIHRSIRSRYPNAKLHFQGRFRVPAVTWDYLHRCWRERNCLRVEVRTF